MEIYVPGRGLVDAAALKVDKAVKEYDERLLFARNEETGQWCVFIKMPRDFQGPKVKTVLGSQKVLPLCGWDHIPHPEDVLKKVYATDSLRHGEKILDDLERHNKKIKKGYEDKASEATGQMAEGVEWAHRKLGVHPNPRVFVPANTKEKK